MQIKKVGVVGAGQMGRGIAQVAAFTGYEVVLFDVSEKGLDFGMGFIQKQVARGVEKEKWDQKKADETFKMIQKAMKLEALKDCDLIVEAATENKELKFKIFKDLDQIAKKSAILASNTSSISITEIAAVTTRPAQVCGMHFMNPVPVMKLVEGIRGLETSDETFDSVQACSEKMGESVTRCLVTSIC